MLAQGDVARPEDVVSPGEALNPAAPVGPEDSLHWRFENRESTVRATTVCGTAREWLPILLGELVKAGIGLGCSGLFVFGIAHAFNKHSVGEGVVALLVPPYGVYLGAEGLWWHDDHDGVDWARRLEGDERILMALLWRAGDQRDPDHVIAYESAVEEFANRIESYPNERGQHLREMADLFVRYSESLLRDIKLSFRRWLENDSVDLQIRPSSATTTIERQLLRFSGARATMREQRSLLPALSEHLRKRARRPTGIERDLMISSLDDYLGQGPLRVRDVYRRIFGAAAQTTVPR